jgi:nucleoside 2-deoxyribosyltransferase
MLTIIGGTYREKCLEPTWDQLYGSGLRAAVAIHDILIDAHLPSPTLITWVADTEQAELELRAQSFGIHVVPHVRAQAIEFQYEHGLAIPRIYPDPQTLQRIRPAEFKVDGSALILGMLEDLTLNAEKSRLSISAESVVYDPQSGSRSVPWSHTGYNCKRLAIVSNLTEADAMLRRLELQTSNVEAKPFAIARALLDAEKAEVVVVKNGAEGAFVVTQHDEYHVHSYKPKWATLTGAIPNHLFPIGTGDVFTGVFAAYWSAIGSDPVEASQRASAAAAYHSALNPLVIPADPDEVLNALIEHSMPLSDHSLARRKVYIAGPLFNFQQRWFIEEVKRCLEEHGVLTFSPYHDVGLLGSGATASDIYKADIDGLNGCSAVFAIVDGLDAGTLFEVGYAVAQKIPVVAFKQCAADHDLTMLLGSPGCQIHTDFPSAIFQAAWAALGS